MASRIKPVTVSVTFAQVNCMLTLGQSKSEHGSSLDARWYQMRGNCRRQAALKEHKTYQCSKWVSSH